MDSNDIQAKNIVTADRMTKVSNSHNKPLHHSTVDSTINQNTANLISDKQFLDWVKCQWNNIDQDQQTALKTMIQTDTQVYHLSEKNNMNIASYKIITVMVQNKMATIVIPLRALVSFHSFLTETANRI